jgi:hypothetical protein
VDIKADLFESGFEVFNDFLSETVRAEKVVGLFEAIVSATEDVEAGFIAVMSSSLLWTFHQQGLRELVCIGARPDPQSSDFTLRQSRRPV